MTRKYKVQKIQRDYNNLSTKNSNNLFLLFEKLTFCG